MQCDNCYYKPKDGVWKCVSSGEDEQGYTETITNYYCTECLPEEKMLETSWVPNNSAPAEDDDSDDDLYSRVPNQQPLLGTGNDYVQEPENYYSEGDSDEEY